MGKLQRIILPHPLLLLNPKFCPKEKSFSSAAPNRFYVMMNSLAKNFAKI
jgi:hypothetical protein